MSERDLDVDACVHGPTLVVKLSAMIRTARIHSVTNQAFKRQLQDFNSVLLMAMEHEQEIALVAIADYLYLNGARIRATASLLSVYNSLLSELTRRSVGAIRFHHGVTIEELERFFQAFMAAEDSTNPEQLFEAVTRGNIDHIELIAASDVAAEDVVHRLEEQMQRTGGGGGFGGNGIGSGEGGNGGGDGDGGGGSGGGLSRERKRARQVFARAVTGTRGIVHHAIRTGRPDLRFAKRLVQPVVDNIMQNEYSIVGLTALKSHDEYTYAHCVNVSTLSVGMGHAMRIPRQTLADLGVVGLIHDIGKVMVPADVLRKPAKLSDEEWRLMRRHPIEGTKMMMSMPGLSALVLESMRTCLEHHMCVNLTGYPRVATGWEQAPMSRIVALADCFDAMTAHRAYRKRPFTQFEALQRLLGPDRDQFDPTVRWALIKTVGVYPTGTLLATDSGHVVMSVSPNPEDPRRPNCKVLVRPDGMQPAEEETWEPMSHHERVERVVKPEELSINIDEQLGAAA